MDVNSTYKISVDVIDLGMKLEERLGDYRPKLSNSKGKIYCTFDFGFFFWVVQQHVGNVLSSQSTEDLEQFEQVFACYQGLP